MTGLALHGFVSPDGWSAAAAPPARCAVVLGGVAALVSEAGDALDTPETAQAAALAHHALISAWHRRGPVLPVRLGTVFSSQAALQTALAPKAAQLRAALDALADKEEMVLTIVPAARPPDLPPPAPPAATGADWLRARKAVRDRDQARQTDRQQTLAGLQDALRAQGVASLAAPAPREGGSRWHLLIARDDGAGLDRWLAAQADRFDAAGLDLTLDGPWPPYRFAAEILEALDG
ncbi:GvpL/GvpF family gas vesicle protein [Rhodobacter capsulatus]|uniref:GvpL/GvpF family gas vesicle protein n=1 Tax=Rhodobacter capsulatus TaxID=1061 RepID=UPI004027D75E